MEWASIKRARRARLVGHPCCQIDLRHREDSGEETTQVEPNLRGVTGVHWMKRIRRVKQTLVRFGESMHARG